MRLFWFALLPLAACNPDGPGQGSCDAVEVLINEVLVDAAGDDEGYEWVELVNLGSAEVDLSSFYIGWQKSESSTGESAGFPSGTVIPAGGYLLLGEESVDGTDVVLDLDLGQGTGGDGVYLFNPCGEPVDAVVYGDSNDDSIPDESGSEAASNAGKPGAGESLARCADGIDGVDTDDPGSDFIVLGETSISPGEANACPCESQGADVQVVINEVLVDPDGADGGLEWIELYNAGSSDACLDLWTIEYFKGDPLDGTERTLPVGLSIPAGSYVTLGDEDVSFEPDALADLSFGNGDDGDAIHLYDYQGDLEDALVYGGSNEDGMLDEGGVATSVAADPGADMTLVRCPDGQDTGASGDDFATCGFAGGTPGESNSACCGGGGACDQASDVTLVINEIMVNPAGADGGYEWVELYNPGTTDIDASTWRFEWYKSDPGSASGSAALPAGTSIPSHGFLLVGEEFVSGFDVEAALDFGNGTSGDAVHLADCSGNLEDAVVYGDDNEDGMQDENGTATSVADKPGDDEALARDPDGSDSNRSGDDFCIASSDTPGSGNAGCL